MGIFGRQAAEIVPHAANDPCNLGLGKAGKGTADVAPGMLGDAQKGTNAARQRTAKGGREIERQKLEHAEREGRSPGLQTISQPGCASGQVPRRRPCACGQLRNSGGNSFSALQAEQVAVTAPEGHRIVRAEAGAEKLGAEKRQKRGRDSLFQR